MNILCTVRRSWDTICFRCYILKCWNTNIVSTTSHFYEKNTRKHIHTWWIFPMLLYICIYKKREVYIKLVTYGNLWKSCTHNQNSKLFISPQINLENICFLIEKKAFTLSCVVCTHLEDHKGKNIICNKFHIFQIDILFEYEY